MMNAFVPKHVRTFFQNTMDKKNMIVANTVETIFLECHVNYGGNN